MRGANRPIAITVAIFAVVATLVPAARADATVDKHYQSITVVTFIPQKRLSAPEKGCKYGSKYEFHGDGRSFSSNEFAGFRTRLDAEVVWNSKGGELFRQARQVGTTIVYRKSGGRQVDHRLASSSKIWVKQLGGSKNQVDLRFSIQARNPFCKYGSIAGAFTLNLHRSGAWEIRSGSHRQMPNWEIYGQWGGGKWRTVYRSRYLNKYCLLEWGCEEAQMGGTYGHL